MHYFINIHRSQGFSLLEVLVASAVFSLGLGGLSLMMLTSLHGTVEARNQTTAAAQATSLAQLILLNPSTLGHDAYPAKDAMESCEDPTACADPGWAAGNLAQWQAELERGLAHATGLVCRDATPEDGSANAPECDGSGLSVVKVFWTEPKHRNDADESVHRLVLPAGE